MICSLSEPCTEVLEGETHVIKLDSLKQKNDALTWRCNDDVIYRRRGTNIQTNANVDDKGSLTLTNITMSHQKCTYKAEHYDSGGKLLTSITVKLCVFCKYNKIKIF